MHYFLFIIAFLLCCYPTISIAQGSPDAADLKNILYKAYQTNPTLMATREELNEIKELYPQARAGWRPSITGETSVYATDIENSNFGNGTGATTKDLTLSVDQPIWLGGRTFAETARAKYLIQAGYAILRQREQEVLLETASAYVELLRYKELLRLRQKSENILQQEYSSARDRQEIGELTKTDVEQANLRLYRAKSEHLSAQNDFDISRARFEQLVGMPAPEHLKLPHIDFDFPNTNVEMRAHADNHNPELMVATFEHLAAQKGIDATKGELLPQISAFASYNKQYDPQPGIVDESKTGMIGLRASVAFYQGGATRSRLRETKYGAHRKRYEIAELKRRIHQEVTNNWHSYQTAKGLTENRWREIELAQQALNGVREESELGQRSLLDILDADEEYIDAKIALIRAQCDEVASKVRLAKSLGLLTAQGLWGKKNRQ